MKIEILISGYARHIARTLLILLAFGYAEVLGCVCISTTACQAFSRADAVFTGKVVSVTEDPSARIATVSVTFEVREVFKGRVGGIETVKFVTGDCDISFKSGEVYFVYKDTRNITNRFCNRTKLMSDAAYELAYAGKTSSQKPGFTIGGQIIGLTKQDLDFVEVLVSHGKEVKKTNVNESGFYELVVDKKADYEIKVIFPHAVKGTVEDLGAFGNITGKSYCYSATFEPNGCNFLQFQVTADNLVGVFSLPAWYPWGDRL